MDASFSAIQICSRENHKILQASKPYKTYILGYAVEINLLVEYINTIKIQTLYWLRARSNKEQITFDDRFLLFGSESFSPCFIPKYTTAYQNCAVHSVFSLGMTSHSK